MQPALRALLIRIVDYAGVFPPAQLDLGEAIRNYADYRGGPDAWMLANFVFPASRIKELEPHVEEVFSADRPLSLSALGRAPDDQDFLNGLDLDVDTLTTFAAQYGERVRVSQMELKLAASATDDADTLLRTLHRAATVIDGLSHAQPFYEVVGLPGERRASSTAMIDALAALNSKRPAERAAGFKLRCGGADPAAVPSVAEVAHVIERCARARVPFKFTAGLHHPFYRAHDDGSTAAHGFLSVFTAAVVGAGYALGAVDIEPFLRTGDPESFSFSEDRLACRGKPADLDMIVRGRRLAISFGSCSFDEPRDDLRALSLL